MRRIALIGGFAAAAAAGVLFLSPAKAAPCPLLSTCESPSQTTTTVKSPPGPPLPIPTTTTTPPVPPPDTAAAARRLFTLVNQERTSRGLPALARRGDIDSIGVGHSKNMAARRQLWHNDAYFTKETKDQLGAQYLGENVAMNASVDDMHRRLMNSPHHRDNILDGRFQVIGIGVAASSDGVLYATEDFAQLRAAAPAPAPAAPTTKAKPVPKPAAAAHAAAPAAPAQDDGAAAVRDLPEVDLGGADELALGGSFSPPGGRTDSGSTPPVLPFALVALAGLGAVVRFILHRRSPMAETGVDDPRAGGG